MRWGALDSFVRFVVSPTRKALTTKDTKVHEVAKKLPKRCTSRVAH
jgi:hypothetical protein